MRLIISLSAILFLAACGVETASTAATSAAIKKQELDSGRQTMERAQEKIDAATARMTERAQAASKEEQ